MVMRSPGGFGDSLVGGVLGPWDSLDGKAAMVTGAGRGLGREHALLLVAEGATVITSDLGESLDGSGVADPRPAQRVVWEAGRTRVEAAVKGYGDLHVLVSNVGIGRGRHRRYLEGIGEEDRGSMIGIHLRAIS